METTVTSVEGGQFIWHELLADDIDAALDFYTHVVGWKTRPYDFQTAEGPTYTMFLAGDTPVGGAMQIDPEQLGDLTAGWFAYVYTRDVDATIERAKNLGGSIVMEPMNIPTVGRMATLTDPQGAVVCVLAPSSSEPMPEPPETGSFSWNELATTDVDAAFDFYRQLFSWRKWDDMDMGDGQAYRMFGQGERMYGGIYNKPADMPPNWLYYVKIGDLDAALERVKESGGRVLNGPMDIPGGERVAQCLDPQGAAFALHGK